MFVNLCFFLYKINQYLLLKRRSSLFSERLEAWIANMRHNNNRLPAAFFKTAAVILDASFTAIVVEFHIPGGIENKIRDNDSY
jgi:hypothetical protein